jgi:hypothetical protein
MGGQACVLYGAAEFSRDIDLAILADPHNLPVLAKPFRLSRGHAIHFRCMDPVNRQFAPAPANANASILRVPARNILEYRERRRGGVFLHSAFRNQQASATSNFLY